MNTARVFCTALLFLFSAVSSLVNAQTVLGTASSCTNANVIGSYGYTDSGWVFTSSGEFPFADSGTLTFDGKGNLTGSSTYSLAGQPQARTLTGTYSVNPDCTGISTMTDNLQNSMDVNLVLVNNGQSIQLAQTDNGTSVAGTATLVPATCNPETINGSYSFAVSGWYYDSSGNLQPYSDTGKLTSNGSGALTLNDTVSAAGSVTTRTVSGTYQVNSHCAGTATLNSGASHLNFTAVAGALEFVQTDAGATISGSATALADVVAGGSMAHIAAGGGWQTTFTLINPGSSAVELELAFFDGNGNPLLLPLTYVQTNAKTTVASVTTTLAAGASLVLLSQGSSATTVTEGSAQLTINGAGNVNGFAIFAYNPTKQEAVVPIETRNPSAFILGFDNTNGLVTGVALANVAGTAAKVNMILRDDTGATVQTTAISLPARGHTSFLLASTYKSVIDKRGTVEFDTPAGGQITALGILATPSNAFTTIPVITL